jgi:hypothetical protein
MILGQDPQGITSERTREPQTGPSLRRASVLFVAGVGSFIGAGLLLASM